MIPAAPSTLSAPVTVRIDALVGAAIQRARAAHPSPLGGDVARLSRLFTTDRAARDPSYLRDRAARRAYLGFYAPQNAAKIALLLGQLVDEGLVPAWEAPAVLDLGAGPWTGLLGVRAAFGALGPSRAVDLAHGALEDGRGLYGAAFEPDPPVENVVANVAALGTWRPPAPVDLAIAANVLNEIGDPRRALRDRLDVVGAAVAALREGGRVLLVEPGTRVHGRALMALRDAIRDEGLAVVLAPCRGAPGCPLLRTPGDWCHQELRWQRPAAFARLEAEAQLPKDVLKLSHLLLGRPGDAPEPRQGLRLVGGTMRDRQGVERRYGCGPDGLVTLRGAQRLPPRIGAPARGALAVELPRDVAIETAARRGPPNRAGRRPRGKPPR